MTNCSNKAPNAVRIEECLVVYLHSNVGIFWYFNTGLVWYEYVFLGQVSLWYFTPNLLA